MTEICDDCLTAMYDEGARSLKEQQDMAMLMGDEVADHICDRTEDKTAKCDCQCQ